MKLMKRTLTSSMNHRKISADYIINSKIHVCLEIPDLFLVLNMINHSFADIMFNTRPTLEINKVFP